MTNVEIKFTGNVRARMGADRLKFSFAGDNLGQLLQAVFAQYDLEDLLLDEDGAIQPWSRIVVNGRFSYLVGDMNAPINDGDMIVLMRPYAVAF